MSQAAAAGDREHDEERVVVRDKRRLDPTSGELREPAADRPVADAGPPAASREAELTADLQRVSAEYANYRKRVDRDRVAVGELAVAGVLSALLPLLDDIERAREHGDLDGAFKSVGEGLEAVTERFGLERYGRPGDPFDPAVHEALMQAEPDPAADVATCAQVLQPGYRLTGGKVLRPARVAVAEPAAPEPEPESGGEPAAPEQ